MAIVCFKAAIIDGNFVLLKTSRTTFNRVCWDSRATSAETADATVYNSEIAAGFTFAVAEIVPAPPLRIFARRNVSLPTNTSNPLRAGRALSVNASRKVLVLFQSPELSFIPAIALG